MLINFQPVLRDTSFALYPLQENDFEEVYEAASDPEIWEQHPNKNRWQRDIFKTYFEGAIQSKGAFKIVELHSGKTIGCTRFYDYHEAENDVLIGYTFYAKAYWGTGANHAVKTLMLNYIFAFVSKVFFHIGATNIRSQISIQRLGALKTGEVEVAYFGEPVKLNFIYCINKEDWLSGHQ
ncbi:MAG: GNAT family N-acetyltransferase [Bacteroidetes bacterium]|nr:GNAT family N-acetyltransferase [Bacteroidota bacterium]